MIHLTFKGIAPSSTYCGQPRDTFFTYHHADPERLKDPEYRAKVCPYCLAVWDNAVRKEPA